MRSSNLSREVRWTEPKPIDISRFPAEPSVEADFSDPKIRPAFSTISPFSTLCSADILMPFHPRPIVWRPSQQPTTTLCGQPSSDHLASFPLAKRLIFQ